MCNAYYFISHRYFLYLIALIPQKKIIIKFKKKVINYTIYRSSFSSYFSRYYINNYYCWILSISLNLPVPYYKDGKNEGFDSPLLNVIKLQINLIQFNNLINHKHKTLFLIKKKLNLKQSQILLNEKKNNYY